MAANKPMAMYAHSHGFLKTLHEVKDDCLKDIKLKRKTQKKY